MEHTDGDEIQLDSVRQNPMVGHWFSQNPIYESDATYSAFPYGIEKVTWEAYAAVLLEHSERQRKDTLVEHLSLGITNPERRILPVIPFQPPECYRNISSAKFLISPPGDRPECYRHWEAIGLGRCPYRASTKRTIGPCLDEV